MKRQHLIFILLAACCTMMAKRTTFCHAGIIYAAICDSIASVEKVYDDECITVPETVSDGTRTYTVAQISKRAFYFLLHTRIVFLPSTIRKIESNAFDRCNGISDLYISAKEPPECAKDAFSESHMQGCTLHVPLEGETAYSRSLPWNNMKINKMNGHKNGETKR